MAEPKPFPRVKLICGIISSEERFFKKAEEHLVRLYGPLDLSSPFFPFDFTDYYEKQMGKDLKRQFLSFVRLVSPETLSEIKIRMNALEEEIREEIEQTRRIVNIDPGYLTASALIMATAKDFAHRIPLQNGIFAHLELLFGKNEVRILGWTYPDYKTEGYQKFFLDVRRIYFSQVQK
ncbi:MAG: DUF4416 family protein [Candidatus Aminicenantes bacterium]|nr:DUF4416 family protein [Candidatus Aminicenantes bacterium]